MKKTLLSIFGAFAVSSAIGQASASWATVQNANWPKVSSGVRLMSAVDANVLWATGYDGTAVSRNYCWYTRTINGGTSFNSGNIFASATNTVVGDTNSFKIASLEGVDANTAWVCSYLKAGQNKGAIHRTSNGGTSWQNMTTSSMFTDAASFADIITFLTPQIGITMGDPNPTTGNEYEIWRTTDGGNTWALVPGANIPNPGSANEFGLTGVYTKLGSSNIWFGTNEGRIYRSTDAGLTWNVSTLDPNSVGVNEIAFTTPLNGYAWLFDASQTLATYKTTDGGANWTMIPSVDPNLGVNNMCAIPGTSYYASGGAGTANQIISYSTDGGTTWIDWGSIGIQYLTVDFVNGTTGWAGGFSDPTTVGVGGIFKYSGPAITSSVAPTAAFSAPPTLCLSGPTATTVLTNASTGSPTPTYSWTSSPAAAFSSQTASSPTVTFTGAGTYTLTLLATNASGTNIATQVVVVQACTTPAAAFNGAATVCSKVTYTIANTSTGAPTPVYTWTTTPSTGATISNPNAATPSFTFSAAGTYSIGLTATNANGTNTVVHSVTVAPCPPSVAFNLPSAACLTTAISPTNATTSSLTPFTYTWSSNPGGTGPFSNVTAPNPQITFTATGIYTITLSSSNVSGSASTTQTVSVTNCTGINENSIVLSSISIFPNPSNGIFSVANSLTNENINYSITNILGSTVSSGKFNNSKNIDLSAQAKGIYFITFENNGNKLSKKIIVE
ncbi:MAG: T9SS type A sorting domain-containing protein [Bacteroidia bacterium]